MYAVYHVPVFVTHLDEAAVAQDAGIVDQNVYAIVVIQSALDDGGAILNRIIVGNRLATGRHYLSDHLISRRGTLTTPM